MKFHFGCQTYTWEVLGEKWDKNVLKVMDEVSHAGYEGIDLAGWTLKQYFDTPNLLREELDKRHLTLAAYSIGAPAVFIDPTEKLPPIFSPYTDLMEYSVKAIEMASHFKGIKVYLPGGGSPTRDNYEQKFKIMVETYNKIADLGYEKGIPVGCHPRSSWPDALIRSPEEYRNLMEKTDPKKFFLTVDTGHVVRSGNDIFTILKDNLDRINHIHIKDVTEKGQWTLLGDGVTDVKGVLQFLQENDYQGWIIAEDESELSKSNQLEAVKHNLNYLKQIIQNL